jgi:hypothetical protein
MRLKVNGLYEATKNPIPFSKWSAIFEASSTIFDRKWWDAAPPQDHIQRGKTCKELQL